MANVHQRRRARIARIRAEQAEEAKPTVAEKVTRIFKSSAKKTTKKKKD